LKTVFIKLGKTPYSAWFMREEEGKQKESEKKRMKKSHYVNKFYRFLLIIFSTKEGDFGPLYPCEPFRYCEHVPPSLASSYR
jgi:hypothetical protein